jgi:anhydro-N-acetylmuramic acid kinase
VRIESVVTLTDLPKIKEKLVVGLMSGTSMDGIDAVLARIEGDGLETAVETINFLVHPYPEAVKERLLDIPSWGVAAVSEMNFVLGELFAEAALRVIEDANLTPNDIHLIGSHGQTVSHLPRSAGREGSTLQLGEPCLIAERAGITTVADFRPRDIAAGGEGAPLVPYVDYLLLRKEDATRAAVNIGGIANVTVVTPALDDVAGFDLGPGNMVIDATMAVATRGETHMDENGHLAAHGRCRRKLLNRLLAHGYLRKPPPKTAGREDFGEDFVQRELSDFDWMPLPDKVATMTEFAARTMIIGFERFVFPKHDIEEIILSGGGVHNETLVSRLDRGFSPVPVVKIDKYGISCDAKEALAFAILANETIAGNPANVTGATGAKRRVVLGKIVPGNGRADL